MTEELETPERPDLSEISKNVTVLEDGDRTYYIIGTAHVSDDSVREVNEVIDAVRPDSVCVELCDARFRALTQENQWKKLDIIQVIKQGKVLFLLANLAIGAYQRRLGDALGVKPGSELLAGVNKANEIGAEVVLVDRDIHITLKRTWSNLGFFKKLQLLAAIMEGMVFSGKQDGGVTAEDVEALKESANLSEMMKEFAAAMPEVKVPLIDERDEYLISSIEEAPGKTLVAVVGAGHVPGMIENFKNRDIDREELKILPPPSRWIKGLKWLIPVTILAGFVFGFREKSFEDMLVAWVLPNSVFAGIATIAAGAKLVSIGSAIVASPITSLNPMLGAGLVVGLVEAWARKPTVADAERIPDDVKSLRGFYRNPFTRVLLVALFATLGSALGGWVGLSWVVSIWAS